MTITGKGNITSRGGDGSAQEIFPLRSYREGDEIEINEMFNEVFHQKRFLDHWYWKYRDNPYGSFAISIAVGKDGTLAAHFAAYPLKLLLYNAEVPKRTECIIYHAGDMMSRKQFRQVGFGKSSLLAKTFMHFKETYSTDALFTYGFLADHSLRFGLLLLNYTLIEPVPFRTLLRENLPNRQHPFLEKVIKGITVETVTNIDARWTEFFARTAPHYGALVKRDAEYLNWRYLQRPDRTYFIVAVKKRKRFAGWSIFHREGTRIIWGDALFERNDRDGVSSVLSYVMSHPFSLGAESIECWFPPRPTWWESVLKSLGFMNKPEPQGLHFCIGNYSDQDAPEMVSGNFYYTMGDSDLF